MIYLEFFYWVERFKSLISLHTKQMKSGGLKSGRSENTGMTFTATSLFFAFSTAARFPRHTLTSSPTHILKKSN